LNEKHPDNTTNDQCHKAFIFIILHVRQKKKCSPVIEHVKWKGKKEGMMQKI
jgi:hypothetical protein